MSTTEQPLREGAAADAAPGVRSGPIVVGAIMVAAGAFLLREAVLAVDSGGVLVGGPKLAPIIVSAGWLTFALLYLVTAVLHRRHEAPPADDDAGSAEQPRWLTPSTLVGALVAYVVVLEPLGFVLSSFAFFLGAARILGSRRVVRDVTVALGLVLTVYLGFTRLLEINLPAGVLPL